MQLKNLKLSVCVVFIFGIILTGCVKDVENFNNDQSKPYDVGASLLMTNAQRDLADQMTTPDVNLNVFRFFQHYWTMTTYYNDASFNFSGTRTVPDNHWDALYASVIGNLESAKMAISVEVKPGTMSDADWTKQQNNKMAILDIIQVYAYQILADSFGDIPYSEAIMPDENVLPKYEDCESVYTNLIERLNADLSALDATGGSFTEDEEYMLGAILLPGNFSEIH
ncbi:SusD/RagB family nutrient-binding outer membrane lipoprotein [Niabella ginsengisoli]|uniref:SusD/RagB family nutrient-binding outer membrane lipoprotein n=1 Tax=Niabella ginsengisoli TaxID=522298 RepID=UPI0021D47D4B|nr:SusD/RagB family nutrient-binding outer membrane lipoprotein [Niabella ginsengisoli]